MGMIRPIGAVAATAGTPTPVFTGPAANLLTATSFSILKGIATIVVANSYESRPWTPYGVGSLVGLYGFTTATYFNGVPVRVLDSDGAKFRFYFANDDVANTSDAGFCFLEPPTYRTITLQIQADAGAGIIYVGDGTVSATKYVRAMSLGTTNWWEIDGDAIPGGRVHIDTDTSTTAVQVGVTY